MARSPVNSLVQISVSISVTAEEAVFELFESLFQQSPSIYTDADTGATTATIYLPEKKFSKAAATKSITEGLHALKSNGIDIGSGEIQIKKIRRENWAESWKKHFKPIEIGNALLIKPSWIKRKLRKNQALVVLDPGLSFGTGQHATTSFCLEQMVACRKSKLRQSFLDIGTGSGILAIAAGKLGYEPVSAFDFDPESVRVSRENARRNKIDDIVRPTQQDLTKAPLTSKKCYDVVCANLMFDLLIVESEKIVNRVKKDGDLILAGILQTQFPRVQKAYEKHGFRLIATCIEKEWQSGHFRIV